MPFNTLGLSPHLVKMIAYQGYQKPYLTQEKSIPPILQQKDVLGIAPTGSGKTAVYALPHLSEYVFTYHKGDKIALLVYLKGEYRAQYAIN